MNEDIFQFFLAVSYTRTRCSQMSSVNILLLSYRTGPKFMNFFTQYRSIIYAVNAHIEVTISHSVSECQSNE